MAAEQSVASDVQTPFRQAGFEIEAGESPQTFAVKKYGCTQLLKRDSKGAWLRDGPPYLNVRGLNCELEDHGYQKFWYHRGKRFAVRVGDLKTLHRFDQEVRAVLGEKSLYHESLGTTSARSAYDRLSGRADK